RGRVLPRSGVQAPQRAPDRARDRYVAPEAWLTIIRRKPTALNGIQTRKTRPRARRSSTGFRALQAPHAGVCSARTAVETEPRRADVWDRPSPRRSIARTR